MIWTPIFCHVLEFQGYLFDLWDRVGERVYSEFLSWLIRYRVWGCGHSALSFTGHQDRQGPRFKGGFLSSEPTQSHEPHCYGLCVCRCYIFSGMYTFFTEVSGMWIFILLLKKRMPFEMSASNKSVLQNLVKQIILSTLRWKILVVRNVRSRSSACVCVSVAGTMLVLLVALPTVLLCLSSVFCAWDVQLLLLPLHFHFLGISCWLAHQVGPVSRTVQ